MKIMGIPTKEEVLNALVNELALDAIKIGGNISAFQDELYVGFLKYLGKRRCTERIFSNFIMAVADELVLDSDQPHAISDADSDFCMKAVGI